MDWIRCIQKTIDYMERHMLDAISYDEIAKIVHISNFHFHRTFSLVTGMSANDYLRKRRLSLAGQELVSSDQKVIDLALKYGYESPESFTKAFARFHGVTPSQAKKKGTVLKSFNRLTITIMLEGGTEMDYRIENREAFELLLKVKSFSNTIINEEDNHEVAAFWEETIEKGESKILHKHTEKHDMYGACTPVSEESKTFDYGIGVEWKDSTVVPEGFDVWKVKPMTYAVFKCIGNDGDCIKETWERIFKEFLPQSEYQMLEEIDFELYPEEASECFCEIWIPVQKKS